jgi:hypothetical protein
VRGEHSEEDSVSVGNGVGNQVNTAAVGTSDLPKVGCEPFFCVVCLTVTCPAQAVRVVCVVSFLDHVQHG